MTEITRVPLRPVAKGSLLKLWLAVAAAVLIAAGVAWAAAPEGLEVETLIAGDGPSPQVGDVVFVEYVGNLPDGTEFDRSRPTPLPVEGVFPDGTPFPVTEGATIAGFYEGLQRVQKGGTYLFEIPAEQAYGAEPPPGSPIPADSDLSFEVKIIDFMSQAEFEQRLQTLQQMMQMQGLGAPAPGVPAPELPQE